MEFDLHLLRKFAGAIDGPNSREASQDGNVLERPSFILPVLHV